MAGDDRGGTRRPDLLAVPRTPRLPRRLLRPHPHAADPVAAAEPARHSPLLAGGVGPRMLEAVARSADGLLVHPLNTDAYLTERLLPAVTAGLDRAARTRDEFALVLDVIVAAGRTEPELAAATQAARAMVAFYASTPAYRPVLEAEGYGDLQPEVHALIRAGRWSDIPAAVDDTLLHRVVAVGTPRKSPPPSPAEPAWPAPTASASTSPAPPTRRASRRSWTRS
ncbi:LLM class flavin-dependent oxidoreductase [Yinghuangia aomiensis]